MAEAQNLLNEFAGPPLVVQRWLEQRAPSHLQRSSATGPSVSRVIETQQFPSSLEAAILDVIDSPGKQDLYERLIDETDLRLYNVFTKMGVDPEEESFGRWLSENKEYPSDGTTVVILDEWTPTGTRSRKNIVQRLRHVFTIKNFGTSDQTTTAYIRVAKIEGQAAILEYDSTIDAGTDPRQIATLDNPVPDPMEHWARIAPTPRTRHAGKNNGCDIYINVPSDPQAYQV